MENANLTSTYDLNVLYVEDDEGAREITKELLQEFVALVDIACDGESALQKYQGYHATHQKSYDLVITDINMPKMNGIELCREIQKILPEQPILVISAHNEFNHLVQLINLGITSFILKPIRLKNLSDTLERIATRIYQAKAAKEYLETTRRLNSQLEAARLKAEEASRAKSEFLANMSHEIRTPLNALNGFITLLRDEEDPQTRKQYLDIISNASDALLNIISDTLDFSKIESGKLDIEPEEFTVDKLLNSTFSLFEARAKEKMIRFTLTIDPAIPCCLISDSFRLRQIVSNILSNAIKFTPENGEISVTADYDEGTLRIRISDTGIGITEEQQARIFDAFAQANGATDRQYGGTGLGLAISVRLAQMLGGGITVDSTPNEGSIFTVTINAPACDIPTEVPAQQKALPERLQGHILLVEDIETNRLFARMMLENVGLTCDIAADGAQALEEFTRKPYDLILMDEHMPNMNGIEATRRILQLEEQQKLPHTPIVALTANAVAGDRKRFLDAGMDEYISKPINPDELIRVIATLLGDKPADNA